MKMHLNLIWLALTVIAGSVMAQTTVTTSGGTANKVPIFTGTSLIGNSVITQSGSSIGIGTVNPADILDTFGNVVVGPGTERLSLGSGNIGFNRRTSNGAIYDSAAYAYQFQHTESTSPASDYLALQVYSPSGAGVTAQALTVNGNGQVGIGTATPGQTLSVNGSISATSNGGGGGLYFRIPTGSQNTVVSPTLLYEGAVSGNGSAATPWGLNLMSVPWTWGQDPITYHAGTHYFRVTSGNSTESQILLINSAGLQLAPGTSMLFGDGTNQTTAWTGVLCGGDYAESVDVVGGRTQYEPGDVMVIDPANPGSFLKSSESYSTLVAGIYSTKPGVIGRRGTDPDKVKEEVPMAMVGIVPVKVSAENGPVKTGDLLVTSATPGYAMKGTDHERLIGAVLGKALGSVTVDTGTIEVLVSLQ